MDFEYFGLFNIKFNLKFAARVKIYRKLQKISNNLLKQALSPFVVMKIPKKQGSLKALI